MRTIDLNADLAEGFPHDAELLALVTSASLSCGAHAGDVETITSALKIAHKLGVNIGAHPSYPDRAGFGRKHQSLSSTDLESLVVEQVRALIAIAEDIGAVIRFVKPHGALYNQAQTDETVALGMIAAVTTLGLPVVGLPRGVLERVGREAGVKVITEGFAERRYDSTGRLVCREQPDAVLHDRDEIAAQVLRLMHENVSTLCIHGDDPDAVAKALAVRASLEQHGVALKSWD